MNHSEIVNFLWGIADLIRDSFKRGKYQDVILPLTVLRRIDSVLAPTKQKVFTRNAELAAKGLENRDPQLRKASGFAFYNTSRYDFPSLLADAPGLAANLRNYIAGFSQNMREVIEKFGFDNTISKLDEAGLLYPVIQRFNNPIVDLRPGRVDNHTMGTIFEELIRKFNEALDENPGEHFTPRDVVELMAALLVTGDETRIKRPNAVISVADPCCGTGGMLTIAQDRIYTINPEAQVWLFGQEVNPETFAVCKSDLFMKSADGKDADRIAFGSTLGRDAHRGQPFDYQIANPPYGKDWKRDKDAVEGENELGARGRFEAGLPRISDGQLLFLLHMLDHMPSAEEGGGRAAIIMNGSPLFTGDAGSGESEIRRYVLENDLLEALVALPEQLFYNTGIATYVWVLTNRKLPERRGKVLLIDASSFWAPQLPKSLGAKRRRIPRERAADIVALLERFEDTEHSKVFLTTRFGYRKITVERPLRLQFETTPERIARLDHQTAFRLLAESRKKDAAVKALEDQAGREAQETIRSMLASMRGETWDDRAVFLRALAVAASQHTVKLTSALRGAIVAAIGQRSETAVICRDDDGNPEPDPALRDSENVPLEERLEDYFAREVVPFVSDAWINEGVRDPRDGAIGRVGYEVNFNRYFYKFMPSRSLTQIELDIKVVETDIVRMLEEVLQ